MRIIALLVVLLICSIGVSSATDYYVSTTGDNSNDGLSVLNSKYNFTWINTASVLPGDTIYLVDGTWNNETIWGTNLAGNTRYLQGNDTHSINITAYNGTPTLDGHDSTTYGYFQYADSGTSQNINISGIKFIDYSQLYIRNSKNIHLNNISTVGMNSNAVYFLDTYDSSLKNSDINGSGWNSVMIQANYRNCYGIEIVNNKFYNNSLHNLIDLYNYGNAARVYNVTITYNELYDAPLWYGFGTHVADGNSVQYMSNIDFSHNIIHDVDGSNNIATDLMNDSTFTNNTIYDCTTGFVGVGSSIARNGTVFDSNTIYNVTNPVEVYAPPTGYMTFVTNNITKYVAKSGTFKIIDEIQSNIIDTDGSSVIEYNHTNGRIFTENGANDVQYFASNGSQYITNGDETVTITMYDIFLLPTLNYLKDVVVNEYNLSTESYNITVNSSVTENPSWINFTVANETGNYSLSVDGNCYENTTSSDYIASIYYSESGTEWGTEHTITLQVSESGSVPWAPTANHIYFGRMFDTNSNEDVTQHNTPIESDEDITSIFKMVII